MPRLSSCICHRISCVYAWCNKGDGGIHAGVWVCNFALRYMYSWRTTAFMCMWLECTYTAPGSCLCASAFSLHRCIGVPKCMCFGVHAFQVYMYRCISMLSRSVCFGVCFCTFGASDWVYAYMLQVYILRCMSLCICFSVYVNASGVCISVYAYLFQVNIVRCMSTRFRYLCWGVCAGSCCWL